MLLGMQAMSNIIFSMQDSHFKNYLKMWYAGFGDPPCSTPIFYVSNLFQIILKQVTDKQAI